MDSFWNTITSSLAFTGIGDVTVWQDVVISAFLIPTVLILFNWMIDRWQHIQPTRLLLNGFLSNKSQVLVYHSQMSGADDAWNFNPNQKYITKYPDPLPTDSAHLGIQKKLRIDPILSQAEADCLAEVYNVLGRCGKVTNIVRADLINDWGKWSNPTFTVGFNPKTMKLMEKCDPVYFKLSNSGRGGMEIRDCKQKVIYDSLIPNDAGVVQKTYIRGGRTPIFILAGLGTAGTGASGYILAKHLYELGKLYGSSPFCVFLKVSTSEGVESSYIDKIYPKPNWTRKLIFPIVYYQYRKQNKFIQ